MNWDYVDQQLSKYLKEYVKQQQFLKDEITDALNNQVVDISQIVKESDLRRFKRFLEQNENYIKENGFIEYNANKYAKRTKITYQEMIKIIIMVLFAKFEYEIGKKQFDTLESIATNVYNDTIKECKKYKKEPKRLPILHDLLVAILLLPNEKGLTYQEQKDADTIYNANQIYEQVIIDLTQKNKPNIDAYRYGILFERQQRREINKKKDQKQKDKYSGIIDDESTFVLNQIKVELFKAFGFEYCQFVGIEDERQTEMCKTLSGQIFNLTELNVYSRYSSLDKKDVVYRTKGMVVGENQPPITNHKHACRSYVMPYEPIRENK